MTTPPPKDHDLAQRIACDAAACIELELEPLVAQVAEFVRRSSHPDAMIAAEETATAAFAVVWDEQALADAYARALADVHEQYLAQAVWVTEAIRVLEQEGRDAWIARAISHQFSFQIAWEVLDRLDLLMELPEEALCAACGAALDGAAKADDVG